MDLPFKYGELVDKTLFVNRKEDKERLSRNLKNGQNTMLISPRRWGKSSLVKQVATEAENKTIRFCFVDLFHIKDEEEFYQTLTTEAIKASSSKLDEWLEVIKKFLQRVSPKISIGTDPLHDFEISLTQQQVEENYKDLLDLPEKIANEKGIRLVICVDEFQSLISFNNPLLFQQRLRASWQHHKHISYCLYGSKKHMMLDIFQNKQMPFYKFGDMMFLDKIKTEHWVKYIQAQFSSNGKRISKKLAEEIVYKVKNHSYYVQQLAQLTWIRTEDTTDNTTLAQAQHDLLTQNAIQFTREIEQLSSTQINFLKALANGIENFHGSKTITTYKLGSSSNVTRIKKALDKKEIIDTLAHKLAFLDPVFELWFQKHFC